MTRNILLNIAIITCKFLRLLYFGFFLVLTGFFVHYQIAASSYENFDFNFKTPATSSGVIVTESSYKFSSTTGEMPEDSEVFTFSNLTYPSLYINFIKLSIALFLIYLCIREFQKVIESVKEIKTFQQRNVFSFRRIGNYLLIIFILISYTKFTFQEGGTSSFYISFDLLVLSLLAYIMAEIFKEGNNLLEENKLTV